MALTTYQNVTTATLPELLANSGMDPNNLKPQQRNLYEQYKLAAAENDDIASHLPESVTGIKAK